MMKLTKFDALTIREIRADLQTAIAAVEAKYGVKLTAGKAKYATKSATISIDMATFDAKGEVVDIDREFLLTNLTWLGLEAKHLDQVISIGNDTFKIQGYRRRRHAKPFSLISQTNSKTYVASSDTVRTALGLPRRLSGWTPQTSRV